MHRCIVYLIGSCFLLLHVPIQAFSEEPALPKIPDNFMSTVEVVDDINNNTNTYSMFVSWKEKRISAIENTNGGDMQDIYDYNSGMKMSAGPGLPPGFCKMTQPQYGPIGFSSVSKDKASFSDVLFYGEKYKLMYAGTDVWRGMNVIVWRGVVKNTNVSLVTAFYFTSDWRLSGKKQQLVAYYTNGYVLSGKSYKNVSLGYNFMNLKTGSPPPEKLSFRPGIYCEEPGPKCAFPKIPYEFEMNVELKMRGRKGLFNSRQYVDSKEKFHRSDHLHFDRNNKNKATPVYEIHDYNTGVSYNIDGRTRKCTMAPISLRSWDGVDTDDHHHIRMKSSAEFFGLDVNKYACKRPGMVRGIPANGFAAVVNGTSRHPNRTMIKEWYFSQPGWMVQGMEGKINMTRSVPLQQTWYFPNGTVIFDLHYFNYDPVETSSHILWMLRYCFVSNSHYMYFRLKNQWKTEGAKYQREIINGLRDGLAKAGNISKLRVSSILIFESAFTPMIGVRVFVLGTPSVNGSMAVLDPKHETPLADAVNNIKLRIKDGSFSAKYITQGKTSSSVSSLDVVRESYYDYAMGGPDPVRPTDKTNQGGSAKGKAGVSQGAAVGIAIAFFFLAVVLTVVVMGFVLKRRGVSLFQFSRFHNEATA